MKNKKIQEELNKISPLVAQIKQQEEAQKTMPKDYFQNFENNLMLRIATQTTEITPPPKPFTIFRFRYLYAGIAAIFIFFLVYPFGKSSPVPLSTDTDLLAAISIEYIDNHIDEFESEEIASLLEDSDLDFVQGKIILSLTEKESPKYPAPKLNSSIEKAIEQTADKTWLEDLTEEDLEEYELF